MWYKVRFGENKDDSQANFDVNSADEARKRWEASNYTNGKNRIFSISKL